MEQNENRKHHEIDTGRWTEDRFAALRAPADWRPDVARGLALLRRKRERTHARGRKTAWVAASVLATGFSLTATPATRAFAQRCVSACVSESNWMVHWFGHSPDALFSSAYISPEDRKVAPDFTLTDASDRPVTLSDQRGKVVLLNFWATWCVPCKAEIPWFVTFMQQHAGGDFAVIGVSMDEDGWTSVRPFIEEKRVNYPIVMGGEDIPRMYGGVQSLPSTFIIDKSGRIAAIHKGLCSRTEYEGDIQAVLKERP